MHVSRRRALAAIATSAGTIAIVGVQPSAAADQPHMQAALNALKTAQRELGAATRDKGGHREKALKLIEDAMTEVQAGIDFDREH
jgi:hypothetical protein